MSQMNNKRVSESERCVSAELLLYVLDSGIESVRLSVNSGESGIFLQNLLKA